MPSWETLEAGLTAHKYLYSHKQDTITEKRELWQPRSLDHARGVPPRKDYSPMTALGSVPKAQMHGEPEGT
jgi:hypothetical protein